MNYRRLGDTGTKISEIGLGGWLTFGNVVDDSAGQPIIDRALDLGINFLDNANAYAGGKCEEAWGRQLAGKRRDSYVLATKVFFPMGPGVNDKGLGRKHIFEQCHHSLKRLKTDYIDLYQCHRPDPETPIEETVRIMDDLIRQGKVVYWGFSEWPAKLIEETLQVCDKGHYYKPKSSQPQYSALVRNIEKDVMPLCHKAGIGQVVWSPLAQGVLTGKYKPGAQLPADSRAADSRQNQFIKKVVDDCPLLEKVARIEPIAKEAGLTMAQLALAWVLRRPEVSSCIIGATKVKQVEENAEASGVKLDREVIARVDEILA